MLIGLLRQASPARKLAMVGEPNAAVRTLALAGLRRRYLHAGDPDEFWSDDETEDKGQPA